MKERTLQGALTFLGFAICILALFYFGFEYIPYVSDWTRVTALILLGLAAAFLGVYLRDQVIGQPFFAAPRLHWLRPPVVMYLLALFCGVNAEIEFLGIESVAKPLKILVSLLIGVGLIVGVSMQAKRATNAT